MRYGGGGEGDCLFLMGERGLVEFDGQLLSAAPVVYDDPPPSSQKSFSTAPLCVPNCYFDWIDLPVGREFGCKFLKKSNPHPMPCLPRPRWHYIDRCIIFFFLSSQRSNEATKNNNNNNNNNNNAWSQVTINAMPINTATNADCRLADWHAQRLQVWGNQCCEI